MPVTATAKRSLRHSLKRKKRNQGRKTILKKNRKLFLTLVRDGKMEEAKKMLPRVYGLIDKAKKVNLIKKNKANREKSKLARQLKKQTKK